MPLLLAGVAGVAYGVADFFGGLASTTLRAERVVVIAQARPRSPSDGLGRGRALAPRRREVGDGRAAPAGGGRGGAWGGGDSASPWGRAGPTPWPPSSSCSLCSGARSAWWGVLVSLYPASTVVLARVILAERVGRAQAEGLGLAAAPVAMIAAG